MNTDRLLKLADFLDTVPVKKFDLSHWIGWDELDFETRPPTLDDLEHNCHTTACAIGWACTIPEFQDAGLVLDDGEPFFDGHWDTQAAANFFDIEYLEASHLFYSSAYRGNNRTRPSTVAKRIRKLVSDGHS